MLKSKLNYDSRLGGSVYFRSAHTRLFDLQRQTKHSQQIKFIENASVFRFLCAKFNPSTLQKSQQSKKLHSIFFKKKSCNLFYMRKQYVLALMTEFCV